MKVPLLPNLIVCALPPQTIVRQSVLAAASIALVLCGAASAQSAPAAPPLSLWDAVEITHATGSEQTYTIESSGDLQLWSAAAPVFFGDGEVMSLFVSTAGAATASGFYRVREETKPTIGRARWSMEGCSMVFTTPGTLSSLFFDGDGAGTMTDAAGSRSFAWQWQRTGSHTGCLTTTWPDGAVDCMELQFLGLTAGAFVSQRSVNGVPAGADSGTFRDAGTSGLEVTVPPSIENTVISFSGSGRPVAVRIGSGGAAAISSPSGIASFTSGYLVTGPNSATLSLLCADGWSETWELEFTGPGSGTCSSKTERYGVARRSGRGTFTIATE